MDLSPFSICEALSNLRSIFGHPPLFAKGNFCFTFLFILFYFISFYLLCFVLFCFVLFCFVLFCFVLFCFVLFCFRC